MNESFFYEYENLSTKAGFNKALSHFQGVSEIIGYFEEYDNLADTVNEMIASKELEQNQILPTVYALLVDKYNYSYRSVNLKISIDNFDHLTETVSRWNGVDIVILYHHPDLGPVLINPKNKDHFSAINLFKSNELVVVFAGMFSSVNKKDISEKAVTSVLRFFEGKKITTNDLFLKGKFKQRKQIKPAVAKKTSIRKKTTASVKKGASKKVTKESEEKKEEVSAVSSSERMTPLYSIPVTNELFHNGNVEAWKKIIQSYNAKHPDLEVYIYYDGERIHDIHSLFKWGKVKHGSSILFAVKGENIKDVAKLQRYLRQGASPMFEAFLKFPVNKILNLF